MLSLLRIQNFALIDQLELEFAAGLNVLTGETGAGKSILLDALDIALGGKVSSRAIRQGSQKAIVEASFQVDGSLQQWLQQQEIDLLDGELLTCSRELAVSGGSFRSRSRVNGVPIARPFLSQLRDRLVEIAAQGQTIQLQDPQVQRQLLDLYGGDSLREQRQQVESAHAIYQAAEKALETRRQGEQERLQRLDWLAYQLQELDAATLSDPEELDRLEQERDRLSHVADLQQGSYQVSQLLYQNDSGEPAAADLLGKAESLLTGMANYDSKIASLLELVRTSLTQVVEAGYQVNGYGDSLEVDPERLAEVEERVALLKRLCRKYGPTLADAIAQAEQLGRQLADLTDREQSIERLERDCQEAREALERACGELTGLRKQAAVRLEKQLVRELKPLAMEKVIFVCQITPCPPTAAGSDRVVFYFSPNPGEKIQPLATTASGGEMSRFLLALKACFSQSERQSSTLIFDEIDAGVSGKVAQAIAEKLYHLSRKHQVLCVTHQPLVAAMADAHFRVDKQIVEETSPVAGANSNNGHLDLPEIRTVVRVTVLSDRQTRRQELAQLAGGHSAEEAISFAESLLAKAAAYRLKKG